MLSYNKFNIRSAIVVFLAGYIFTTIYIVSIKLTNQFSAISPSYIISSTDSKVSPASRVNIGYRPEKSLSDNLEDYSFDLNQHFEFTSNEQFDITLITYFPIQEIAYLSQYITYWAGPLVIVAYYTKSDFSKVSSFQNVCKTRENINCIFYEYHEILPINTLKNKGIEAVTTTHFLFAENNLIPSTQLYEDLKLTPGYLWKDPYFVGVIPAFEWSSDSYSEAESAFKNPAGVVKGQQSLKTCLSNYHCRPLQTTTISLQFRWFSFINYRAMNCIDENTDIYMVLKKTSFLPKYDESVVERGYDNMEYVEKIRYSNMKIAQLGRNFLFRVSGIGMDSRDVVEKMKDQKLKEQYDEIKKKFIEKLSNNHPIVNCNEIERSMRSWISFKPYQWIEEEEKDNMFYPKIAVEMK